jgi:DNA processing protein
MIEKNKINIIRLSRSTKIGPISFFKLMKLYNNDTELIIETIGNKFDIPSEKKILQEIEILHENGGKIITYLDEEYPWMLHLIEDKPPVLSIYGNLSDSSYKKNLLISIVGTRNSSIPGFQFAEYIAKELAIRNFIVVSGLANGIDSSAHKACLKENRQTVAIIGSGLSQCYPNKQLALNIVKNNGVIISEFPFFEEPKIYNFPRRNRIIAGFSAATIVVEAGLKSGSKNTANHANKYGRTVFAVPGFPTDYRSSGTNQLIKDGAIMITSIQDILDELKSSNYASNDNLFEYFSQNTKLIFTKNDEKLNEIEEKILSLFNSKIELDIQNIFEQLPEIPLNKLLIALSNLEIINTIGKTNENRFYAKNLI